MTTTGNFKKQLPRNAIAAIMQFVTATVVAVWLTPYLVRNLGKAAYGLVPLAALLTQYVAVITVQLSLAVRRFLIVEIQKPDGKPNVIFNSALGLYLLMAVIQAPLFALVISKLQTIFTIPHEILIDAQILFSCSAISFLLNLIFGVFGVSIYAHNRLDISASIDLVRSIIRVTLIVLFFAVFGPGLRYIGMAELLITLLLGVSNIYYWRKFTPELSVNIRHVDARKLAPIFKMSFWTLVNNIGALLYLRTDLWIINKFISPDAAGKYAAILVISDFVRRLGLLLSNQSGPMIITYSARQEWDALRRLLYIFVKTLAVFIAIPIGIICALSPELLRMWLGESFLDMQTVLWVAICHLFINVSVFPLFNLQTAVNKVRVPGLVTFSFGIVNVIVVYLLGIKCGMGVLGVAVGGAIVLTLKNAIFTPVYGAKILKLPLHTFIMPIGSSFVVFVFVILLSKVPVAEFLNCSSGWSYLLIQSVATFMCSCVFVWFVLVNRREKDLIVEMLPQKIGAYLKKWLIL